MKQQSNRIRIIAGQWRGRFIDFADLPAVRPTPNRVRETLFNWLQGAIEGADCLDLFAGSGALSIEAVSRGARHAVLVESDRAVAGVLSRQIQRLGSDQLELCCTDAFRFLQRDNRSFDIVFLDPPFATGELDQLLEEITSGGTIKPSGLIYVESDCRQEQIPLPQNWRWKRLQTVSKVSCGILQRVEN